MAGTNLFEQKAMTDWPTLALIAGFWIALLAIVAAAAELPVLVVIAALAILGCLYMSLQHEVIHGHPTRSRRLNWAMVAVPLGLVLPFARYRHAHVAHHRSNLTDPVDDPESFYVLPSTWDAAGPVHRAYLVANRTVAGRLLMGPLAMAWRGLAGDAQLAARDPEVRIAWLAHVLGSGVVLTVVHESSLPIWVYLFGFVYLGSSLTSLRSFAEHHVMAGEVAGTPRSAVVRTGRFFSLLFLNNNLHYTHHQLPGAAWFRLPELTDALDADTIVAGSAGAYDGYGTIVRRHLFRPFGQPVHPLSDSIRA